LGECNVMAVWTTSVGRFRSPAAASIAPDEALRRLYDEQSQSLLRLATLLVWAMVPEAVAEIAEEIVHEAFAGMHREWRRLRDADKAVAYLRRAVVRRARLLGAAAPGDRASVTTTDEMLAALRVMPGHQCEALVLRYYANLPEAQAADAMGVSRGAFRWHLAQGMTSLRAFLDQGDLPSGSNSQPQAQGPGKRPGPRALGCYQAEVADLSDSWPAGVLSPDSASSSRVPSLAFAPSPVLVTVVSGSESASMASRYRRQTSVATAPAAARTVADRADHARADRSDRLRRRSGGVTCRAVVRSADDTRGATVFVSAAETAGAAVVVVYSAASSRRGPAQPRAE
jgi:DNA-directed RNA polymerase specialized sigma24 family protein